MGIRGLREAEEITHTDLWTKSHTGESGQESDNDSPPELRHFRRNEQIWEELVFHSRPWMKSSVRMNGMYLTYKYLLIETLYYELYYYGY